MPMPQSIQIAVFVLGGVLLLVAILGGRFKIFGAEIKGKVSKAGRGISGVLGVALLVFSLVSRVRPNGNGPNDTDGPDVLAGRWARRVKGYSWVIERKPNGEYSIVSLFHDGQRAGEGNGTLNGNVFSFAADESTPGKEGGPDATRLKIRGDLRLEGDILSGRATARDLGQPDKPVLTVPMTLRRMQ